ncbi:hypothetical protein IU507_09390 [Nocardia cyriacigeorgica]|nr:hypothetical protein [Nocardia cyriacigeorgica]
MTGAGRAGDVGELVTLAQADGCDVCVLASPSGARFIDAEALATQTGYAVQSEFKVPGTKDLLQPPDGVGAAPLATSSMAKWAAGISDTCHWRCWSKRSEPDYRSWRFRTDEQLNSSSRQSPPHCPTSPSGACASSGSTKANQCLRRQP